MPLCTLNVPPIDADADWLAGSESAPVGRKVLVCGIRLFRRCQKSFILY